MVTPHLPAVQLNDRQIVVVPQCQFCRFWLADDDGLFGECRSETFAEKVYAQRDEGSPIMTAQDFNCPMFEVVG
jgi:hypothetical protein